MAFGLPAYHLEIIEVQGTQNELIELIKKNLEALDWKIIQEDDNYLQAKTLSGTATFGERIHLDAREDYFAIKSECTIPTQIVDFGKNKGNVKLFKNALIESNIEFKVRD